MFARSFILLAGCAIAAAPFVPGLARRHLDLPFAGEAMARVETASLAVDEPAPRPGHGSVFLATGPDGRVSGLFTINGHAEEGRIDPASSMVRISVSTAARLGIDPARLAFRYAVETDKGMARAAYIRLDHVGIGPVRLEKVGAMVLEDRVLDDTLIGMSFLKGLKSYDAVDDGLRLTR